MHGMTMEEFNFEVNLSVSVERAGDICASWAWPKHHKTLHMYNCSAISLDVGIKIASCGSTAGSFLWASPVYCSSNLQFFAFYPGL